jgi:DNA/RNA endonuclease YhcR with UshA esterase domain
MMKRLSAGLFTLVLLILATFLSTAQAQQAAATINSPRPFTYNVSEEVTLKGTVSTVLEKPSKGMIMGSHLVVNTSTGTVDASLGTWALRGKGAVPVTTGVAVELTGVMKTIKNQPVFLVRTLKEGGQMYSIRNEHGFPLTTRARERAEAKTTQKGEGL